jgi:hypothetical protein
MKISNGQKFTNTKSGKTIVVLKVKPFGRVDMGKMMDGEPPRGMTGVVAQWNTTQSSVRAAVADGLYASQ